jgi:hypothetical protein
MTHKEDPLVLEWKARRYYMLRNLHGDRAAWPHQQRSTFRFMRYRSIARHKTKEKRNTPKREKILASLASSSGDYISARVSYQGLTFLLR